MAHQVNETFFSRPSLKPNYSSVYSFEKIEIDLYRKWIFENWNVFGLISLLYLVMIFVGPILMRDRAPYKLKTALLLWNAGLSLFSFIGFIRTVPELIWILTKDGSFSLHNSVCFWEHHGQNTAFWMLLFTISKVAELFDTVFIILRKGNLIFLHWYHHVSVLAYCITNYPVYEPKFRWFMSINFGIHAVMYFYYSLMTMGYKIDKRISKSITTAQLTQMVIGAAINIYCLYVVGSGYECESDKSSTTQALLLYGSYFFLFLNFFTKAYGGSGGKKEPKLKSS